MVREWGAKFLVHKQAKVLNLTRAAVLLIGSLLIAGSARAQVPDPCPTGQLGMGMGQDIVINKRCNVGSSGSYNYGDVNIIAGGSLVFQELLPNVKINFWAKSILVENGGSLLAGEMLAPFGKRDGVLTIHLYGADQGVGGKGIICQSPVSANGAPCGIPDNVWLSKGASKVPLPGQKNPDYFYQYSALPIDNGEVGDKTGFFGYKVLAVSFGGTLNLFGSKGLLIRHFDPKKPARAGSGSPAQS